MHGGTHPLEGHHIRPLNPPSTANLSNWQSGTAPTPITITCRNAAVLTASISLLLGLLVAGSGQPMVATLVTLFGLVVGFWIDTIGHSHKIGWDENAIVVTRFGRVLQKFPWSDLQTLAPTGTSSHYAATPERADQFALLFQHDGRLEFRLSQKFPETYRFLVAIGHHLPKPPRRYHAQLRGKTGYRRLNWGVVLVAMLVVALFASKAHYKIGIFDPSEMTVRDSWIHTAIFIFVVVIVAYWQGLKVTELPQIFIAEREETQSKRLNPITGQQARARTRAYSHIWTNQDHPTAIGRKPTTPNLHL